MEKIMHSVAILGCVALLTVATPSYSEEMPGGDGNDGRILTINFIDRHSSAVDLHYRVYEKGPGAKTAMILMESLKRKLAEKGYEHRQLETDQSVAAHHYSVVIASDTGYSESDHALERREGHLMVMIVEREFLDAVDMALTKEKGMEYRQIEDMADKIVARLVFHSYI